MLASIWHSPQLLSGLPKNHLDWLTYPGSFMQRLAQFGRLAHVSVLRAGWLCPSLDERKILHYPERKVAWVREVIIADQAQQWMIARAVFPKNFLVGKEQIFMHLQNQPLGSLLFGRADIKRHPFEFAQLATNSSWCQPAMQMVEEKARYLWARRSLFTLAPHKQFLLTEAFLPKVMELS